MDSDKRRYPRRRTLKSGKVVFNNRHSTMDCTIRNMSEGGALLLFARTPHLPDQFELRLVEDNTAYPCRRAWQQDTAVGVEFLTVRAAAAAEVGTGVEVKVEDVTVFSMTSQGISTLPRNAEEKTATIRALGEALAILSRM